MDRIVALIHTTFALDFDIHQDTPLISTGIVDSLHVAQLLIVFEREYGRKISPRDIGTDNFDTPRQMALFLSTS